MGSLLLMISLERTEVRSGPGPRLVREYVNELKQKSQLQWPKPCLGDGMDGDQRLRVKNSAREHGTLDRFNRWLSLCCTLQFRNVSHMPLLFPMAELLHSIGCGTGLP